MGKTARGVIGGVALLMIFGSVCAVCIDATRDTQVEEPADPIQEKIDAQFSAWDGSHRNLVAAVEKTLNDPGSFEHLETRTMKGSNYPRTFLVSMQYTAKNAFGGRVRNTVVCEVDVETGAIIQVLSE
ncbi:MAG: hypothetical protein OXD39_13340 [Gemmatimonadetes bacterium]|nr:hypothetical protein [Gemmatimonadota bacterium]